ncbi:MAG TPA: response regulator [Thermoplasmata archaeon]|nr:response regulator [Thermoplasmata archaeon]
MQLLVVDDNTVFREELAELLSAEGYRVAAAATVAKALDLLDVHPVDLVFTDLKMPRQSGMDLLKEIRRRWPQVLVVVVTGFATVETAVEAMKLGAFDYVSKPFRAEQIRRVLALAWDERAFAQTSSTPKSPSDVAEQLANRLGPVLYAASAPGSASARVEPFAFDGKDLPRLRDALEGFLGVHPKGGIVIAETERLMDGRRPSDVVAFLQSLLDRIEPNGPFALGYDASQLDRAQLEALRSVVSGATVHGELEALANPIRRRVLVRLREGPGTFSDAMRAAELDDSPKMTFHLHRLLDQGLIARADQEYRLTPKGEDMVTVLREMERLGSDRGTERLMFARVGGDSPAEARPTRAASRK